VLPRRRSSYGLVVVVVVSCVRVVVVAGRVIRSALVMRRISVGRVVEFVTVTRPSIVSTRTLPDGVVAAGAFKPLRTPTCVVAVVVVPDVRAGALTLVAGATVVSFARGVITVAAVPVSMPIVGVARTLPDAAGALTRPVPTTTFPEPTLVLGCVDPLIPVVTVFVEGAVTVFVVEGATIPAPVVVTGATVGAVVTAALSPVPEGTASTAPSPATPLWIPGTGAELRDELTVFWGLASTDGEMN
jgi:hypothetical protein